MRHIKRVFLSLALTCVLGFAGFILYFLAYDNSPYRGTLGSYLFMWPLIVIEHLGGTDVVDRPVKPNPVAQIAWISLWAYYYLLLVVWQGRSHKR